MAVRSLILAALLLAPAPAVAGLPADPLASPMWQAIGTSLFGNDPVRFDARIKVIYPEIAENQRSFPVTIDARAVPGVKRMLLFADLNPIPLAIDYTPDDAEAFLSIRIKLDQRTPVRGAVQLVDGSWLIGGGWVDAAGGGCSMPPLSRARGDWAEHLGEMRGIAQSDSGGVARMSLAIRHPMDTGLVGNTPVYNIDRIEIRSADRQLGALQVEASVAEDPAITLMPHVATGAQIAIAGSDTNGMAYAARLTVQGPSRMPR